MITKELKAGQHPPSLWYCMCPTLNVGGT